MLPVQDGFLDAFIVDFYSTIDEDLIIKPLIGWGIDDKLSYYIGTRNFNADITIHSEDINGFRNVYVDVSVSLQPDGYGPMIHEVRLYPIHQYYHAVYRILKACGFICLPAWYLPVKQPPVCMNGLYYV